MQVGTPVADALERYLDLSSRQMQLTATNMANIDTPDYKTEGIDFEDAFQSALRGSNLGPETEEVNGLIARPDGNNVSMDRESMQMAQTQLQFRTGIELLKHEMSRVSEAIRSDGK